MRVNWQHWHKAVTPERCEEIKKLCYETGNFKEATIFKDGQYIPYNNVRETKIAWVADQSLRDLVSFYLLEANRNAFGFIVDYLPDIQFGEYSQGSFYNWHYDVNWEGTTLYDRKLSLVIQLSDEDDYEGGNFEFKDLEQPVGFRSQGSVLVFPSYITHRVTEVTKGQRNSLVCWMEGPRWR